jgi:DNA ligase-1
MKPMLACSKSVTSDEFAGLRYPLIASAKLDGIRSPTFEGGEPKSRTLKPIPNRYVNKCMTEWGVEGLDGELMLKGSMQFCDVSSAIMNRKFEPDFQYWVFDAWDHDGPYSARLAEAARRTMDAPAFVKMAPTRVCHNAYDVAEFENECLDLGFEGIITRDPEAPYKHGRSTRKQEWMLTVKRFEDSEAEILDTVEEKENQNEAKTDLLGHTERSSHQANKVGKGRLGKFKCRDIHTGVLFSVPNGAIPHDERLRLWLIRDTLPGLIVKYKYLPAGAKDGGKPRHPVFLGFRHPDDI